MGQKEVQISFWDYLKFYIVIGILSSLVIWLHYRPWKTFYDDNRLEKNGIETTAKLVKRHYNGGSRGGEIYTLILEYIPNKQINEERKTIRMNVHSSIYGLLGIDEKRIPILYLADDPDIIKLKHVDMPLRPLIDCIILDLLILGVFLYGVFDHFRKKRNPPQIE